SPPSFGEYDAHGPTGRARVLDFRSNLQAKSLPDATSSARRQRVAGCLPGLRPFVEIWRGIKRAPAVDRARGLQDECLCTMVDTVPGGRGAGVPLRVQPAQVQG